MDLKEIRRPDQEPKGDKLVFIVFALVLGLLFWTIVGLVVYMTLSGDNPKNKAAEPKIEQSSREHASSDQSAKSSKQAGSRLYKPEAELSLKSFGDKQEFLQVTPKGSKKDLFNSVLGMGSSYLVTEAYEGAEFQDKSTSSGKSYQFETYNLYFYDTNSPIRNLVRLIWLP